MSKAGSKAGSVAGGTLSRAESCASTGRLTRAKSIKAKAARGIELAPRKARRKAYEAQEKEVQEISAGQIWDFWAVKANKLISTGVNDSVGPTVDTVTDAILGKPKMSEADERTLRKQQEERLRRQQKAALKQRALLDSMKETVFGKGKTKDEIDEEIRLQEESILQAEQLERLQRKFEGELTLL
jgi:hypothetical protein